MITLSAATSAISLAQEFDRRGSYIKANSGSEVGSLNSTIKFTATDANPNGEYDPKPSDVSLMSNGWSKDNTEEQSEHTLTLKEISKAISSYVRDHLNFAKNKVRPIIEALVNETASRIEEIPSSVEFARQIIVEDLPLPMQDASIAQSIEEYKGVGYVAISSYISLPGKTAQEIKDMIKTNTDLDNAIDQWVAKVGDSLLEKVFLGVFTSTPGVQRFENLSRDPVLGADSNLLVYLLCLRLYDNPPEGCQLNLSKYNEYISELRNQAALRLYYVYLENTRAESTKLLIKRYNDTSITVVGNVYRDWIDAGGSNVVLFGSVLSARPSLFAADLNENKDTYVQTAMRQNHVLTVAHRNRRFVNYKEAIQNCAIKVVGDHFNECYSHLREGAVDVNVPEYVEFTKRLPQFIDSIKEDDFKDVWHLCQSLVCECIFYYTDAQKILNGIENACKVNQDIHVREAALLSTIEYVTNYVCDQLEVRVL